MLVGTTLGAAAVSVMAPSSALSLDAATYVMSALSLASIRRPFRRPQRQPEQRQRARTDIVEGLRFLLASAGQPDNDVLCLLCAHELGRHISGCWWCMRIAPST